MYGVTVGLYALGSQLIYHMLETSIQELEEDPIPPGLLCPLLGLPKTSEKPLLELNLIRTLDGVQYGVTVFQDRLVGNYSGTSSYFCLDDEVSFTYDLKKLRICFQCQETHAKQIFLTENQHSLSALVETLKLLCPQACFHSKFELMEEVGKGKKSKVYSARRKSDKQIFAVKIQTYSHSVWDQISILRQLKHPNIIYFRQFFLDDNQLYIIMDYEDGGHLLEIIDPEEPITKKQKIAIITDLLNALQYLRMKDIVHRDLKPENILFSKKDGKYKIGDFGFSKKVGAKVEKVVGTPGFIAPQIFQKVKNKDLKANIKWDIYSMGLIFYEIFTGKQYYEGKSRDEILDLNMKGVSLKNRNKSGFQINALELNLLQKMIRRDPDKRKNSSEILKSQTYKKLNKKYGLEQSSTCSPKKKRSSDDQEVEEQEFGFLDAFKKLLSIRSSSNSST